VLTEGVGRAEEDGALMIKAFERGEARSQSVQSLSPVVKMTGAFMELK